MRIEEEIKLDFCDVLIRPKRSTLTSRSEVELERKFKFKYYSGEWQGIPIIASNMDTIGVPKMYYELTKYNMLTCFHKHINFEEQQNFNSNNFILSTGFFDYDNDSIDLWSDLTKLKCKYICIDVANGYIEKLINFVERTRLNVDKDCLIIAGNVVTAEMTEALILAGADIVKVGIGPSAVCTTRKITGIGYPQLSAVIECADAAHGLGGHIISDGGCSTPGDIAKAFGAGADFVMLGSMLSGTDESAGEIIEKNNKQYKRFYGMSSKEANEKHFGGLKDYRAAEGRIVEVPYKGPVRNTIQEILGGLRSTCTYVGAKRLKDLPKCTTFIKVNRQLNNTFEQFEVHP